MTALAQTPRRPPALPLAQRARTAGERHWREGVDLARRSDWRGAARAFGRATRVHPGDSLYWMNLAHAERHAGRVEAAILAAQRGLQLEDDHPVLLRLLADCQQRQHRYAEAAAAFARIESLGHADPAETMLPHASALLSQLRFAEAGEVALRALTLAPGLIKGHALLASALRDQGRKREAVECLKTVLALDPGDLQAWSHLSFEKRHVCDWSDFETDLQQIRDALATLPEGMAKINAAFADLSLPLDPLLQLAAARSEALAHGLGVKALPPQAPADFAAAPRIRVGWLSYDFRQHPVSQLLVEMLESLDRERFEVLLFSCGPNDHSPLRARVVASADQFIDLHGLGDDVAAQRIRDAGVELLVDLMGHTRGNRMPILARRPAPLQVAYLGFPGSTGAPWVDYLVGDPLVTPLDLAPLYSEKLAQMPLTFQPNGRWRPLPRPMTRAQAGLPEDAFVLCTFNHTYKILPEAFDVWCDVLREEPRAVLWMRQPNEQLCDNVAAQARARGVDPARIIFAGQVPYEDHFSRLALADLFVDTWPYNAHTTAADALWAGVPVVTVYQNGFASRVAASVLNAAGIGELAFATVDDYRLAILALAREPGLLQGYRDHLARERQHMPLFDSTAYTRQLEALLARMVARWRAGLPAEHLPGEAA